MPKQRPETYHCPRVNGTRSQIVEALLCSRRLSEPEARHRKLVKVDGRLSYPD
jgi:hypothetical protein